MTHIRTIANLQSARRGFTLIEVLVALLVLSIGLLGLAALQNTALQFNTDSYQRTQATLLVYDILDRMRANSSAVSTGNYDVPTSADANSKFSSSIDCSGASSCTAANLATYDLRTWYEKQRELQGVAPGNPPTNPGTISRDAGTTRVTITIRWMERDLEKTQKWVVEL